MCTDPLSAMDRKEKNHIKIDDNNDVDDDHDDDDDEHNDNDNQQYRT